MFKECIQAQMNLQHLGCWNHLEKLAEMFLNTFYREHILLILKIKKLLRKIKSKTCRVDLHVVIAMWYTALFKITASFRQTKNKKFGVMWAGRQVLRQ